MEPPLSAKLSEECFLAASSKARLPLFTCFWILRASASLVEMTTRESFSLRKVERLEESQLCTSVSGKAESWKEVYSMLLVVLAMSLTKETSAELGVRE